MAPSLCTSPREHELGLRRPRVAAHRQVRVAGIIHRSCGQLCGQLGPARHEALKRRGAVQIAQTLSMEKSFKINGLRRYDNAVTRVMAVAALRGAVVEFSTRTGIGFARG
jgi:hypothetical protein